MNNRDKLKDAKAILQIDALRYARLKVFGTVENSDGSFSQPWHTEIPARLKIFQDSLLDSAVALLQVLAETHPDKDKAD